MDLESLLSKAKLESQSTVEQVNRHYAELKQKYCAIDGELNLLTSKYNQAKVELQQAHSREGTMNKENENIVDCSEVHMLKKEVSRLNEQIQLRDCRIKKLNAVKMTKEQCTALKRMKVILQG
jgi:predicted  nucleic acid-binding Zn-ribbon protein